MKFFTNKKAISFRKKVALALAVIMLAETAAPSLTLALTSGPAAPEFSSFEPVTTTNMVDEFSGDFTYNIPVLNIPGANGGGYAMSLAYHSGESAENESSWVGYGWTLNPGAINRGKRGFADDTKNTITYYNDVLKNWTVSTGASIGNIELFSFGIPVSLNSSIRYNNYRGFGYTAGAGLSFRQGLVTLGYSVSDGAGSFSAQVNPAALLSNNKKHTEEAQAESNAYKTADKAGKTAMKKKEKEAKKAEAAKAKGENPNKRGRSVAGAISALHGMASSYGMFALSDQQQPTTVTPYEGFSINTNFNLQINPAPLEIGPQIGFYGNYNYQKNKGVIDRQSLGYLYSSLAYDDPSTVMDYYLEKESTYNKRDRFMSIPFSNADMFSVTGEGLGGAFRLYNKAAGYFRPNGAESSTLITQLSGDINLGLEYGGGFNLGLGNQTLKVNGTSWGFGGSGNADEFKFAGSSGTENDDVNFLRYNNDLGGSVDFHNESTTQANIVVDVAVPGAKACHPNLDVNDKFLTSKIDLNSGSVNRSGRASYLSYHTNDEMNVTSSSGKRVYAYEKSADNYSSSLINRGNYGEQIGEVATVNEDGNTYVYGLPVMVKNETSMQYDLKGAAAGDIENNFRARKNISCYKMRIGEVDNGAYASSYLLTQITTPDYVDRTLDGPTMDDFGGYTKFEYVKTHNVDGSGATVPYHYRMPFNGLNYSKGEMSDPSDDMGAYNSGDKDIAYLDRIVTKTHIAVFERSDREDGYDALNDVDAAADFTGKGSNRLQKLDAIKLYTNENGSPGKLVKTVYFEYNYSLCGNIPNSGTVGSTHGKLTLTKIWFEYDGIVTAKISPYKFSYAYPTVAASPYPSAYSSFQSAYAGLTENPDYSPFAIDAWGNYQEEAEGASRFAVMKTAVDQIAPGVTGGPSAAFDPAAWQLKAITLPSGGEIHVQYEQDDYLYVQNRRAEALVSIQEAAETTNTGDYTLNVAELGITSTGDKNDLVAKINERYTGDKIYFKFLYALIGTSTPDVNACNSDYVTGYVNFKSAEVTSGGDVVIHVGDDGLGPKYDLPRDICLDLVKKQKGGKLDPAGNCDASTAGVTDGLSVKAMVMQLLSKIGTSFFAQGTSCLSVKPELSYFKIPVLNAKKGGGLRVKRILMYDKNGIDTNVSALYGSEYFYQAEDGKSSGVATNEPASLRDENALVVFLPKRNEQSFLNKAIAGTDRTQFEGPIGESLLPSASVGYSRVVTKNIHSGKTNTGFVVSEFYTVKDYPFDMRYRGVTDAVSNTSIDDEKDWMNLPAIVFNYSVTNIWASQGYRFILNSMHGQPKTVATYSGDYAGDALTTYAKSSSTEYQYFEPGESINVQNPNGDIVAANPGKDMEVAYELKSVEDVTADASIEVDFGVGIAGLIPLPQASLSPLVNYSESKLRTHVTSKVIKYPAIQKAVITSQEGIVHKTENLVFSAYTGKPVKVRTTDGYNNLGLEVPPLSVHDGSFTSYSTPAYQEYREMGQKAINERQNIPASSTIGGAGLNISSTIAGGEYYLNFSAVSPLTQVCDAMGSFTRGDLVKITPGGSYFHIDEVSGNSIKILPATLLNTSVTITSGAAVSNIEIIKSGRTNQLTTMAGGYVTYGAEQAAVPHAADPVVTAQRQSFIDALDAALPSGATISMASYPFVVRDNSSCVPITNDIVVDALTSGHITIHSVNTTDYVQNGNFSSYTGGCTYPFNSGCVSNWSQAYGLPGYSSGSATVQSASNSASSIMQNGVVLDPAKQYIFSCGLQDISGGFTGVFKAMLANPATSGLPRHISVPPTAPVGQQLISYTFPGHTTVHITSSPFTPVAGNTQLYLFGNDIYGTGGQGLYIDNVSIVEAEECATTLTTSGTTSDPGHFGFDESGNILFYSPDNDCYPQTVACFKFCDNAPSYTTLANVVTSGANTFACNWAYEAGIYPAVSGTANVYENGTKGKWRVMENYVNKSDVTGGSAAGTSERNYNDAGVYTMTMFNWQHPSYNPSEWVKTNTVKKYSPNGDALEEQDAIGIYSAAKFGYNGIVPYLVAQNSKYDYVQFQSFEKNYGTGTVSAILEDGLTVPYSSYYNPTSGNIAHSGKGSYMLTSNADFTMNPFLADGHLQDKGVSIKVWVKDATRAAMPVKGRLSAATGSASIPVTFTKVAQTGEWTLYEARVFSIVNGVTYTPVIKQNISATVYVDDVRVQPMDAQMNAYVYDPVTLRLLTSFDDQHFGLYYQYNQEGKLVRKMLETEKGMKTITETQYNTPAPDNRP